MALIKEKKLTNGLTVTYWKILDQNRSDANKVAHYTLGGWADKQARLDYPQNPLDTVPFEWSGDDYPFTEEELTQKGISDRVIAYEAMKKSRLDASGNEINPFVGALDA